ncbi:FixH family protein [Neobacillus rhizosphaerae]|uniref:FixH family protein n=1 Tax=Neobacillus rhizosphaerae TaxID=2880965 RepID=UPI003D2C68D8
MKKFAFLLVWFLLVLMAGCSSNDFKIELLTPKSFTPEQPSTIQIKVLDSEGKPVTGAKVSTDLNMHMMSHGDISMKDMKETSKGVYTGNATFEMEGDYTATIQIDDHGKKWTGEKRFSIVSNQTK